MVILIKLLPKVVREAMLRARSLFLQVKLFMCMLEAVVPIVRSAEAQVQPMAALMAEAQPITLALEAAAAAVQPILELEVQIIRTE